MRWMMWQPREMGQADVARRVIGCHLNPMTRGFKMRWMTWQATSGSPHLEVDPDVERLRQRVQVLHPHARAW